jgi:hypothetical protein
MSKSIDQRRFVTPVTIDASLEIAGSAESDISRCMRQLDAIVIPCWSPVASV